MALSYKARKRWSLVILLLGLPLYVITAVGIMTFFWEEPDRPPVLVELAIYVALGILWAVPFKKIFMGIGQADPEAKPDDIDDS